MRLRDDWREVKEMSEAANLRKIVAEYRARAKSFDTWGWRLIIVFPVFLLVVVLMNVGIIPIEPSWEVLGILWTIFFTIFALGIILKTAALLLTRRVTEMELQLDFWATKQVDYDEGD